MNSYYHQFNFSELDNSFRQHTPSMTLDFSSGIRKSPQISTLKLSSRRTRSNSKENQDYSIRPKSVITASSSNCHHLKADSYTSINKSVILKPNYYVGDATSVRKKSPSILKKFIFKKPQVDISKPPKSSHKEKRKIEVAWIHYLPTYDDLNVEWKNYMFRPTTLRNSQKKSEIAKRNINFPDLRPISADFNRESSIIHVKKCKERNVKPASVPRRIVVCSKTSSEVQTEAEDDDSDIIEPYFDLPINERDVAEEESPTRQ
ncbi:unnamed protein product [Blepharisma stoltei]|uniref:Uncharacterized protein n=1 Tax=Blepharisma stoltei TaxID=1481888 RepID=A0AAU9JRT8_9CILI|nr:unnamed protein product [Blepharisma stoltei]